MFGVESVVAVAIMAVRLIAGEGLVCVAISAKVNAAGALVGDSRTWFAGNGMLVHRYYSPNR